MSLDNSTWNIQPFALEIICLVGKYVGTKSSYFESLFKLRPWLMGDEQPNFHIVKNKERTRVPDAA